MSKVSIIKCDTYNQEIVTKKLEEAVELIGGISSIIKPNDRVFIKLNCVGPFEPSRGITTHPAILEGVISLILPITKNIIIGDNPATRDIISTMKRCGLYDIVQKHNLSIISKDLTTIINSKPKTYSTFEVSKDMVDVDCIINLPKLKTHSLAYMTCCEKNFFGLIYGLKKASWHVKASNPLDFGNAINDLYGALLEKLNNRPILNILDGIIGLEGEGPSTGGTPKSANCLIVSKDAISVDRVAVEIVNLNYNKLFINKIANERGYGVGQLDKIEILGSKISDFKNIHFLEPKDSLSLVGLKFLRIKALKNILLEHPKVNQSLCIRCGECAKICPPKAMEIKPGNFPHLTSNKCIRCWCCMEVCPQNAIKKTKRPLISKVLF